MSVNLSTRLACVVISLLLSACSSMTSNRTHHETMCNTLKSQLVFNGGTGNSRRAEIEESESPLVQHSYDKNCE